MPSSAPKWRCISSDMSNGTSHTECELVETSSGCGGLRLVVSVIVVVIVILLMTNCMSSSRRKTLGDTDEELYKRQMYAMSAPTIDKKTMSDDPEPAYESVASSLTLATSVARKPYTFVLWTADWCGHCQRFKPIFEEAAIAAQITNPDVQMTLVNGPTLTASSQEPGEYNVPHYPFCAFYKDGVNISTDDCNERSVSGVMAYIETQKTKLEATADFAAWT